MKKAVIDAPAKINLHLEVGSLREDGYHDISTIMHTISLFDTLFFEEIKGEGQYQITGDFDCSPKDNLIFKAIAIFKEYTNYSQSLRIRVEKRIPHQAGLGGGSSDAAATLKVLNALSPKKLSHDELLKAGTALGSDVPFLINGGAAYAEGRGDKLKKLPLMPPYNILITVPKGISSSTPEAYQRVDAYRKKSSESQINSFDTLANCYDTPPEQWFFINTFHNVLKKDYLSLVQIKKTLYNLSCKYINMSGSGLSFFAISPERIPQLDSLSKELIPSGFYLTKPCKCSSVTMISI